MASVTVDDSRFFYPLTSQPGDPGKGNNLRVVTQISAGHETIMTVMK